MAAMERHPFAAPDAARQWAAAHEDDLPTGLEITDGRLYARHFYDLSLAESERELGAGSLIHVAARADRPEMWGFEVDYGDPVQVLSGAAKGRRQRREAAQRGGRRAQDVGVARAA